MQDTTGLLFFQNW